MTFVDNSEVVKRELERAAIRGLIKASMLVESQAALLVPVDTGALRNSIGYKVNESELAAYIGTNCEYAIYVEYGKKPVPYKNWAKSVNIFCVYIILDNWRKTYQTMNDLADAFNLPVKTLYARYYRGDRGNDLVRPLGKRRWKTTPR